MAAGAQIYSVFQAGTTYCFVEERKIKEQQIQL